MGILQSLRSLLERFVVALQRGLPILPRMMVRLPSTVERLEPGLYSRHTIPPRHWAVGIQKAQSLRSSFSDQPEKS